MMLTINSPSSVGGVESSWSDSSRSDRQDLGVVCLLRGEVTV